MTGEAAVWFFVGVGVGLALAMFGFLLLSLLDRRALRRASLAAVEPTRPAPPKRARLPRTPPVDAAPPLFGTRIEPADLLDDPIRTLPQELLVPEPETLEFPELDFSDPEHHVSSPRIEPRSTARTRPSLEPVEPSIEPPVPAPAPVRSAPAPMPEMPPAPAPQPGRSGRRSVFDAAPVERPARLSTPLLAPREPKVPVPPTSPPPTTPAPTTTLPPAPIAAAPVASSPLRFPIDTPSRRPFTEIVVPTPISPQLDAEAPPTTTVAPSRPTTLRFRSATTTTARPQPTTVAPTTTPAPATTAAPVTTSTPIAPARPTTFGSFRAQRVQATTTPVPAPTVTEPPPPPGSVEAIFAEAFSGDQEPSDGKPES